MTDIDGNALRAELKKRGLSLQQASREIGGSEKWLADCAQRGRMARSTMVLLEKVYNITPDSYIEKKPGETRIPDGLEDAIQKAVHEAITKYFEEEKE
jgi:lambda repressor-like predicted transcriptional regulator